MFISILPIAIGYFLDLIFGDPNTKYHPICLIGNLISKTEKLLLGLKFLENKEENPSKTKMFFGGVVLWLVVVAVSFLVPYVFLNLVGRINIWLKVIVEGCMCYFILAQKSLKQQSMAVYDELLKDDIVNARRKLSYIVGRDTENLDVEQVSKATVETIAENTSDGVIAPLFYMFIGGAPLGFLYKAVNTLDSMVGYKNEKYLYFGRFSAKLDDVFNFIPSRISAFLIMLACFPLDLDYQNAWFIFKRDRKNHPSPNSAQSESACAGALGIMLGGGSYYGGHFCEKKTIGDSINEISTNDIVLANKLLYVSSGIFMYICSFIKLISNFNI